VTGPATLPDLLREGLDIVFVGINPSVYSATLGHYFARPGNRFWPCFSHSRLSLRARQALGVRQLQPTHDRCLPDHGFGFTDVAKRATPNVTELGFDELAEGASLLRMKLDRWRPRIACFHGVTGYRPFRQALEAPMDRLEPILGLQRSLPSGTRLFVVPNPSGANAHFTRAEQTAWYDRLADALQIA
jgi:double-stranded uracil-DNA glycosylase